MASKDFLEQGLEALGYNPERKEFTHTYDENLEELVAIMDLKLDFNVRDKLKKLYIHRLTERKRRESWMSEKMGQSKPLEWIKNSVHKRMFTY